MSDDEAQFIQAIRTKEKDNLSGLLIYKVDEGLSSDKKGKNLQDHECLLKSLPNELELTLDNVFKYIKDYISSC